jgi:hypothetical protein
LPLADKTALILWAIMTKGERYGEPVVQAASRRTIATTRGWEERSEV